MPRRDRRTRYMRDRAERRMARKERRRDYGYPMGYGYDYAESRARYDSPRDRARYHDEERYMGYEQPRESSRMYDYGRRRYDMNYDYRGRDYADDDYDKEYYEDLHDWIEKLKKYDRFNMPKEQVIANARQMGVAFEDYDEDEFYATYLMQVSDYPTISNEPRVYLDMAKSWLEDKDIKLDGSEKLCKYMYEIAMAEDDD